MLAHLLYLAPSPAHSTDHLPLEKQLSDASYSDESTDESVVEESLHPFLKAAQCGDIRTLRKYEREHQSEKLIEIRAESNGYSALHYAVLSGCEKCVAFLVAMKFPVNIEAKNGVIPLALTEPQSLVYGILTDSGPY